MSNVRGVYSFRLTNEHVPIPKIEYEQLIRDSMTLEILINEALLNPYFSKEDLLRITGYVEVREDGLDGNMSI